MQPLAIATQSFAANPLFRGCKAKDPAFLAAALHDGRALLVKGQTVAMQGDELVWVAVNSTAAATVDCYLLGQLQSEGWHAFTVDVSAAPELAAQHTFVNIRKLLAISSNLATVALAGQATALASWHASCKFCGGCGQPTAAIEAGLKRACSACKRRFYPRTDPCVNVLVVSPDGQKILLGRRAGTAPATKGGGVYSNLAGFVEQGESVEECAAIARLPTLVAHACGASELSNHHTLVLLAADRMSPNAMLQRGKCMKRQALHLRKLFCLAGHNLGHPAANAIRCRAATAGSTLGGSCELMLGVFAQAASEYITADAIELSDAGWFDRPTVKAALARSTSKESPVLQAYDGGSDDVEQQLWVPGPYAIAYHLMALWADRDDIFSEPLITTENSGDSSNSAPAAAATAAHASEIQLRSNVQSVCVAAPPMPVLEQHSIWCNTTATASSDSSTYSVL
eukprot:20590-Heterococcus_DN1.PRE.3